MFYETILSIVKDYALIIATCSVCVLVLSTLTSEDSQQRLSAFDFESEEMRHAEVQYLDKISSLACLGTGLILYAVLIFIFGGNTWNYLAFPLGLVILIVFSALYWIKARGFK